MRLFYLTVEREELNKNRGKLGMLERPMEKNSFLYFLIELQINIKMIKVTLLITTSTTTPISRKTVKQVTGLAALIFSDLFSNIP